jgi:hypothetical protein
MGHIKEPKGVDFIIKSEPLTDNERKAISAFIRNDKAKRLAKQSSKHTTKSKNKQVLA